MALQWRQQLSVGNDLIDSDHKYLIEIINLAAQALRARDRAALNLAIDKLSSYSQAHFSREELLATAAGYPAVARLNLSHQALLEVLAGLKHEIGEHWTDAVGDRTAAFLRDWLVNHVIKEDMLMKPYLSKRSPRWDPR